MGPCRPTIVPISEVCEYLSGIKPENITDGIWGIDRDWSRMHGDGKGRTSKGGKYFETQTQKDSNGKFIAKVLVNSTAQKEKIEITPTGGATEPSAADVIDQLKTLYGCK